MDPERRLAKLEDMVRRLSDELELIRLTASYGPIVDSGEAEQAAALWVEDGVYETDLTNDRGRDQIAAMVRGSAHQAVIAQGSGHAICLPRLRIDGETATGVCHSLLFVRDGDGYRPWRVSANRWEFVRTDDGWRIKHRSNRLLDGTSEARMFLAEAVEATNVR